MCHVSYIPSQDWKTFQVQWRYTIVFVIQQQDYKICLVLD